MYTCIKCGTELERISRTKADHRLDKLSGGLLAIKRYYCFCCLRSIVIPTRLIRPAGKNSAEHNPPEGPVKES